MKNVLCAVICSLALTSGVLPVFAQESEDVTEYEFTDVNVSGEIIGPNGELITAVKPPKTKSLIKIRKHFIDTMLKSVENI